MQLLRDGGNVDMIADVGHGACVGVRPAEFSGAEVKSGTCREENQRKTGGEGERERERAVNDEITQSGHSFGGASKGTTQSGHVRKCISLGADAHEWINLVVQMLDGRDRCSPQGRPLGKDCC